jgi:hypothetical protein
MNMFMDSGRIAAEALRGSADENGIMWVLLMMFLVSSRINTEASSCLSYFENYATDI